MDSPIIIWWILAGVSSILTAYLIHRNHSEKLRIEEARLKKESLDVNYDYNRFNTKDQRTTNIEILVQTSGLPSESIIFPSSSINGNGASQFQKEK